MENFNTIFQQLELQYGVEMNEMDAIDLALLAWEKIGNKRYKLYRFRGIVNPEGHFVQLPCNCDPDLIEAVTYDFEDWNYTDNVHENGDLESQFTESYIESRKRFSSPHYLPGKFVKYEKGFDRIYIYDDIPVVNILYKGVEMDEDQLPYISTKEADAIACFVAYTDKFKQGWRTNNAATLQLAQSLEQRWNRLCNAARVTKLNQNDLNEILDVKTAYGRKFYGKSFKPIR